MLRQDATAQAYFNQAMLLAFAFNHDEANTSLTQALGADPTCCMCLWGVAYVNSPNINRGMSAAGLATAQAAVHQATLAGCSTAAAAAAAAAASGLVEVEVGLAAAMAIRFPPNRTHANGKAVEALYVEAMARLASLHTPVHLCASKHGRLDGAAGCVCVCMCVCVWGSFGRTRKQQPAALCCG